MVEELEAAQEKQNLAQQRLKSTNENFERAKTQLKSVSSQANKLRTDIQTLLKERKELIELKTQLDGQIEQLRGQVSARDQELKKGQEKIATRRAPCTPRSSRRARDRGGGSRRASCASWRDATGTEVAIVRDSLSQIVIVVVIVIPRRCPGPDDHDNDDRARHDL